MPGPSSPDPNPERMILPLDADGRDLATERMRPQVARDAGEDTGRGVVRRGVVHLGRMSGLPVGDQMSGIEFAIHNPSISPETPHKTDTEYNIVMQYSL